MGFLPGVRDSSQNVAGAALEQRLCGGLAKYGKAAGALNEQSVSAVVRSHLMANPGMSGHRARLEVLAALTAPDRQPTRYSRLGGYSRGNQVCLCEQGSPCRCGYSTAVGGGWGRPGNPARYAKDDPRAELESLIADLREVLFARADTLCPYTRRAVEHTANFVTNLQNTSGLNEPPLDPQGLTAAY